MPFRLSKSHLHSILFLISRVLLITYLFLPSCKTRLALSSILLFFAFHQIVLFYFRARFVDERRTSNRAHRHRIIRSSGVVGKVLAAVEVYLWDFQAYPHPINLMHWIEKALEAVLNASILQIEAAMNMDLIFRWSEESKTLFITHSSKTPKKLAKKFQMISEVIQSILETTFPSKGYQMKVLRIAPSWIVWFAWLLRGRAFLACLQDDPREQGYHIDSVAAHLKRRQESEAGKSVSPECFGVEMSSEFEKGISRAISVHELDGDPALIVSNIIIGSSDRHGIGPVVHQNVFCISYRHLEDKKKEAFCILASLQVAAEVMKQEGKTHFHIWIDKILRLRQNTDSRRWAVHGLLPYAYYPLIAVRNMTLDEVQRMWLLAEERLAFGNMGILRLDVESLDVEYISDVDLGPAHSVRMYLRYLKTGEAAEERTFHEDDRRRFIAMADSYGYLDDEQGIYQNLMGNAEDARIAIHDDTWWPNIVAVETYACLRRSEVTIDKIEFVRDGDVPFDGFREWFKYKDTRSVADIQEQKVMSFRAAIPETDTWVPIRFPYHYSSVYRIQAGSERRLAIIIRNVCGGLLRTACICLRIEKIFGVHKVVECTRIQLKYDEVPDDDEYLTQVCRLFSAGNRSHGFILARVL